MHTSTSQAFRSCCLRTTIPRVHHVSPASPRPRACVSPGPPPKLQIPEESAAPLWSLGSAHPLLKRKCARVARWEMCPTPFPFQARTPPSGARTGSARMPAPKTPARKRSLAREASRRGPARSAGKVAVLQASPGGKVDAEADETKCQAGAGSGLRGEG